MDQDLRWSPVPVVRIIKLLLQRLEGRAAGAGGASVLVRALHGRRRLGWAAQWQIPWQDTCRFAMHSGNQPRRIYSNNQPRTHVVHQVVVRGLVEGHLPADWECWGGQAVNSKKVHMLQWHFCMTYNKANQA